MSQNKVLAHAFNQKEIYLGHRSVCLQAGALESKPSTDLRPHISGFFDTTSGGKKDAASYSDIRLALGANNPADICFATDILDEAKGAAKAGWVPVLVKRPGNADLPASSAKFQAIETLEHLLKAYAQTRSSL
jgi:methionine salvage enolase-phosphatase E1